jgi:adsorption protein A
MKLLSILLLSSLAFATTASAQVVDLGSGTSDYTRFLVYPHLQKASQALQRGDRDRAIAELEQARRLAPDNAVVALQLAEAHRHFGQPERAEALLRAQSALTPADRRVATALAQVRASMQPSALVTREASVTASHPASAPGGRPDLSETKRSMPPPARRGVSAARRPAPTRDNSPTVETLLPALPPPPQSADDALEVASIDRETFALVQAGETRQAALVLMQAYPFAGRPASERHTLLERLGMLIAQHSDEWSDDQRQVLKRPLETAALRSRQAGLFASLADCNAVLSILGDLSPEYAYDDWMRIGDCATGSNAALARDAFAQADALQPGRRASIALAYDAHAAGDVAGALAAWRRVGVDQFSGNDLLGAATTALAAADEGQAEAWLKAYLDRGEVPSHRYWSLVAEQQMRRDPAAAAAALRQAIALQPAADDYVRLARLEADPARHVALLERAAELDPANGNIQAALGYAHWNAGRASDAQRAFERAWNAAPTDLALTEQLVYVYERTKQNDLARAYARRVLDATEPNGTGAGVEGDVERRFAFQRLHEEQGRRVTVSADTLSGTSVGASTNASLPGRGYRSFAQFEVDVRMGAHARPDSALSAYARVLADGGPTGRALPLQDGLLGVGLRWKPWRSRVLYLAAENQIGLDDQNRRDVMLRASGSFLGGGRSSDDWHPAGDGWISRNFYLDGAHYLKTGNSAFTADFRTSYHRKIAASQTIEPYGRLQFNGVKNDEFGRDIRAGVGLRWNIWQGANAYDAAPHRIVVGVEFQQAIETYLPDRNGVFLTLGARW